MTPKLQRSRPGGTSGLARTPLTPTVESPIVGTPPANKQITEVPNSETDRLPQSRSTELPKFQDPEVRTRTSSVPDPDFSETPRYLQLVRKEARLRLDQVDALAALTRQLGRRRTSRGGERLTDNTLIRVAVDLLLEHADQLGGNTEDELLSSLKRAFSS
jgi:hypothetical protein